MKIIQLHKSEKSLIQKAIKSHRASQQQLFDTYAPKMLGVCRKYIKDQHHAEEVMLNGFLKVFTHLKDFAHQGSFEGWIRKIMVREAISFLRKQQQLFFVEDAAAYSRDAEDSLHNASEVAHLQAIIDGLPTGYRTVFVLYAIEGYKHREIAALLKISENTSKSQLSKARRMLQERIEEQKRKDHGAIGI